jgi:Caspase domain
VTRPKLGALAVVLAATATFGPPARAQGTAPHRYAIIVGANRAAPGRRDLRFAHDDAQAIADILIRLGDFPYENVNVLLDPEPAFILAALDAVLARESPANDALLVFYYSGHADADALYPNGRVLSLAALRQRLDDKRVGVRIGVIDACRGGGWTGAKGLKPAPPFPVEWPVVLENRGSVLISSSSGVEDAHESEALRGSFFTHHWNAGLRGAADVNGDGAITASEAFEYAQALTIRDTALVAEAPQHPSFRIDLLGRRDVTLVSLARSTTTLTLRQTTGPLQLLHLDTGLVVLETPRGPRELRVSVRPGRYLVRRRADGVPRAKEIALAPDSALAVAESDLVAVTSGELAAKGAGEHEASALVVPARDVELQVALGVRHAPVIDPGLRLGAGPPGGVAILRVSVGLGHGWQLMAPLAVAHGGGNPDGWEHVAWGGVPVVGISRSSTEGLTATVLAGLGLDLRRGVGGHTALNLSAAALGSTMFVPSPPSPGFPNGGANAPSTGASTVVSAQLSAGFTHHVSDAVSLSLGVAVAHNVLINGDAAPWDVADARANIVLGIGSLQRRGLRPLPLVRVHLADWLALDGHVAVAYLPATHAVVETYLAGATAIF